MHLKSIKLSQFKNYETQALTFCEGINCFVGQNGMGKTNLLDAIYYLCMCKSNFALNDRSLSKHGESFFRLEGQFLKKNKKEKIVAKVIPGKKKEFERNSIPYKRLIEHIGLLPVVMIVPDDTQLINEGSEERRRFLDNTLSQIDATYLNALMVYNKILRQRNAALKEFAANRTYNDTLIQTYNRQLLEPCQIIFEKRNSFVISFAPLFAQLYGQISKQEEGMSLTYASQLIDQSFEELLHNSKEKDRILQRTCVGIHKDDIKLKLGKYPLKKFGSQGQLKSFVLAMKLAQYEIIKKEKKEDPVLLLDDIFDKLDAQRVENLIQLLLKKKIKQVFITDTHEDRLEKIIKNLPTEYRKFNVSFGTAKLINNEER